MVLVLILLRYIGKNRLKAIHGLLLSERLALKRTKSNIHHLIPHGIVTGTIVTSMHESYLECILLVIHISKSYVHIFSQIS